MATRDQLRELDGTATVPRKNGELVFDAPWQSRAFGIVVSLHEKGLFVWDEFKDRLIAAIADHPSEDESASPAAVYYRQWLIALEGLLVEKGLVSGAALDTRAHEFLSGERE